MKRMLSVKATLVGFALVLIAATAKSEDASWGCQVLLCAASQNPSWHGIGYCVPPMTKLISAMKKPGFSWPICHEANAGKPGHEVYEECPAGTTIGYSMQGDNDWQGDPDQCIRTVNVCQYSGNRDIHTQGSGAVNRGVYGNGNDGCLQQITTPRPRRVDPYFFDIPNDQGVKQRLWFNLSH